MYLCLALSTDFKGLAFHGQRAFLVYPSLLFIGVALSAFIHRAFGYCFRSLVLKISFGCESHFFFFVFIRSFFKEFCLRSGFKNVSYYVDC